MIPTWTDPLTGLMDVLKQEAWEQVQKREKIQDVYQDPKPSPWAARRFPRGAMVMLRVREDHLYPRRELRIWRKSRPATPDARAAWQREVQVFLKHLQCERWHPIATEEVTGIVAAFVEAFSGETGLGQVACADCGVTIPYDPAFTVDRCTRCALEAGKRATAPPAQTEIAL